MNARRLSFPISSINPVLVLSHGETGTEARHGLRVLACTELRTPWLADFLDETLLGEGEGRGRLSFRLTLKQESGLVRAKLVLAMEPTLECARSLTLFCEPICAEAEAFFRRQEDIDAAEAARGGMEHELTEDDLSSYAYAGASISVDEFLLDTMRTAMPDRPLCRPDCNGLCAECGAVRNDRGTCGKETAWKAGWACPHFPELAN